jgi:thioredoxin 1
MTIIHTTDAKFEQDVISSTKPVLVDFWADWCAPCRRIAPILEELADEQSDFIICKMDIVAEPNTKDKYEVKGLPSLLLFKNGQVIGRKIGALSKAKILEFLTLAHVENPE